MTGYYLVGEDHCRRQAEEVCEHDRPIPADSCGRVPLNVCGLVFGPVEPAATSVVLRPPAWVVMSGDMEW